jgi:hypothetical protein
MVSSLTPVEKNPFKYVYWKKLWKRQEKMNDNDLLDINQIRKLCFINFICLFNYAKKKRN